MPKKIGASTPKVTDSRRSIVARRNRAAWWRTMPATKAPNTGWTPIFSVAAAHKKAVTITSTRSESRVLKCSVANRTVSRRTG
jgi:hypothetical protein